MDKIKVGQKLFSLNVGNAARWAKPVMTPVTVIKVGRKYFTTRHDGVNKEWTDTQYHITNWAEKSNYSATSMLYGTLQDYSDEQETNELHNKIRETFGYRNELSLNTLKLIMEIIDGNSR